MHFFTSMQTSHQASGTVLYGHNGTLLEIEARAYNLGTFRKQILAFPVHLRRMERIGEGWRGLYPAEAFSFLDDHFKGKLSSELSTVAEDMLQYFGEWFDIGLESPQEGILRVYFSPRPKEGFVSNNYISAKDITSSDMREYTLNGLQPCKYYSLQEIATRDPRFCQDVYGKDIGSLDARISKIARVLIAPNDGNVWPMGFSGDTVGIDGFLSEGGASRAVRVVNSPER